MHHCVPSPITGFPWPFSALYSRSIFCDHNHGEPNLSALHLWSALLSGSAVPQGIRIFLFFLIINPSFKSGPQTPTTTLMFIFRQYGINRSPNALNSTLTSSPASLLTLNEIPIAASLRSLFPGCLDVFTSIDEWNHFASSLFILPVVISEFFGQHPLLHSDTVEDNRGSVPVMKSESYDHF